MLPVVALVGRPNVGKSTLFNALTGTRDALVADEPGLTRDRRYGYGRVGPMRYIVIDTGGLVESPVGIETLMVQQTLRALAEADRVIFVTDVREGVTAADRHVATLLRRSGKPVFLAINKAEGRDRDVAAIEFHAFGFEAPLVIAALHREGIKELMERALHDVPVDPDADVTTTGEEAEAIRVAVVGRPNVGKSTLINRLIGEERLVAFNEPGTTRDSVYVPFERDGHRFTLIDTAGVRRKARVDEGIEQFSVVKALQAIEEAHVVIAVLDAHETVADQDASLLGFVANCGRALVIAVNKWDGILPEQRDHIRNQIALRLPFVDFAPQYFISARHGTAVGDLLAAAHRAYIAAMRDIPTPELTRVLERALEAHQPPLVRGRRIKLRYAHQGGRNPPVIVIHGNQVNKVPEAFRRYLINTFRQAFRLEGTPVRVEFRTDTNPFAGRRNDLTPRQRRKRVRVEKRGR